MSRIKLRDTKAELIFRKSIWGKGIRGYRLKSKIKGKPDLYFPKTKSAVFIDGCFWHRCPRCFAKPKSNNKYWNKKIKGNVKRDIEVTNVLQNQGIRVIRIWEHEIKKNLNKTIKRFIKEYEKEIKNH